MRNWAPVVFGVVAVGAGVLWQGCGGSGVAATCDIGSESCPCTSGNSCNDGLKCYSHTCVNFDGAAGASGAAGLSGQQQSPIVGSWVFTAAPCALGVRFDADGYHEQIVLCVATDNSTQLQKSTGTWSVIGNNLTTTISQSTCSAFPRVSTTQFQVTANALAVATTTGEAIYAKASGMPSGSALFTYGCFDISTGAFSPAPLSPI